MNIKILEIYDVSKIGALTMQLLALDEPAKHMKIIDSGKVSYHDLGFHYKKNMIGVEKKHILKEYFDNFKNNYNKNINTRYINANNSKAAIIFNYAVVDLKLVANLKAEKIPFIYCFIQNQTAFIFTSIGSQDDACIKCFYFNENKKAKIKKNLWKTGVDEKSNHSNIFAMTVAIEVAKTFKNLLQDKIDSRLVRKITQHDLSITNFAVVANEKCVPEKI